MNEWSVSKGFPEVSIRCGVHTGRVLVGNMGFDARLKYGIVGEESHIPAHLEEMNKTYGTAMLISEATYMMLPGGVFVIRPIDFVRLRAVEPGCDEADSVELIYEVL